MAEDPAILLHPLDDGTGGGEGDIKLVIGIILRHGIDADERSFVLEILAEGIFAIAERIRLVLLEVVGPVGVFHADGEGGGSLVRDPFEHVAPRFLVQSGGERAGLVPLAAQTVVLRMVGGPVHVALAHADDIGTVDKRFGPVLGNLDDQFRHLVVAGRGHPE